MNNNKLWERAKQQVRDERKRFLVRFGAYQFAALILITAGVASISLFAGVLVFLGLLALCGCINCGLAMVLARIDGEL